MTDSTVGSDPSVVGTTVDTTVAEVRPSDAKNTDTKTEPKTFDADYVKSVRDEAAKYRTERNAAREQQDTLQKQFEDLQSKLTQLEREKLSDTERKDLEFKETQQHRDELLDLIAETRLEAAVAKNVRKFDLADADATLKLLDIDAVEYNDKGHPTNIEAVLEKTLERYPFLRTQKKSAVDTGTTNPGRQKNAALTREAIQAMTHEERVARMPEIQQWMANGYK